METPGHRRLAATAVLVLQVWHPAGVGAHLPLRLALVAAGAAYATGGGPASPDVDNQGPAKTADRLLPDEALGHGGPLGHRRLAHSWMALAAVGACWHWYVHGPAPLLWAVAYGVWVAWWSHLAGDFVFGRANPRVGLPRGIPLFLWWGHAGLGLLGDGPTERATAAVLRWAAPALAVYATTGTPALALAVPPLGIFFGAAERFAHRRPAPR